MSLAPQNILLLLLALWVAFYFLTRPLGLDRRGVEIKPLYMMVRTKRFNEVMLRTAAKRPRVWRMFADLGIAASLVEITLAVYTLSNNLYNFTHAPQSATPIVPILPGVTISLSWFPYILLAIGIAVTIHEAAHGVVASLEKIQVKSSGIVVAPITFGAFVEPDEEGFEKAGTISRLRVLAAGSFTNAIAGLLTLLLIFAAFSPVSGVLVTNVTPNGPAASAGMQDWDVIYSIDGSPTPNYAKMQAILSDLKPGDTVILNTSRGQLRVKTVPNPENSSIAFLGIRSFVNYRYYPLRLGELSTRFTYHFRLSLEWIQLIMINLAIFNMLPMYPLDGEGFVFSVLRSRLRRGSREVRMILNAFSLTLLGLNIVLSFISYGITPL